MGAPARLVLINGLPGSGKSTLAARYCADHPLSVCLDIDVVRGLIGRWLDHPTDAGALARRMALAMIGEAVPAGHDVVVPQLLARSPFIEELEDTAGRLGARFDEIVLLEPASTTAERLRRRASSPASQAQHDAHTLLDRDGGLGTIPELHQRLITLLKSRPRAGIVEPVVGDVEPVVGDVERTYRAVLDLLDKDTNSPARHDGEPETPRTPE